MLGGESWARVLELVADTLDHDLFRLWGEPPGECTEVGAGGAAAEDFYGDRSDGDLVGTTPYTRDMFLDHLTIPSGETMWMVGILRVRKLTIESGGS